jgi:prefoldin subunit 2
MAQAPQKLTPQQNEQVIARFRKMSDERDQLRNKLIELQQESREHELVLQTLGPLDAERRAWRKVGGVLVERNVGQCREMVQANLESIVKMAVELNKQWELKESECEDFQRQFQLSVNGMPPPPPRQDKQNE